MSTKCSSARCSVALFEGENSVTVNAVVDRGVRAGTDLQRGLQLHPDVEATAAQLVQPGE